MGGRLIDWLGQGTAAARPVAATVAGLTSVGGAAVYFANDTKILSVYDHDAVDWLEIDVAAFATLSFQTLPDVDWVPPSDGDLFAWDLASGKLVPFTLPTIPTQYTDELAQDAIGNLLAAGAHIGINPVYNDAGNLVDLEVTITQYTDVDADARVNTLAPAIADTQIGAANLGDLANVNEAGAADGEVLTRVAGAWESAAPAGSAGDLGAIHCYEEQPSGTAGGGSTANTWVTRVLNVTKSNTIPGASRTANEITLPVGTYETYATAPVFGTMGNKIRLFDVTAAAVLLDGETSWASVSSERRVAVQGRFILAGTSNVRIEVTSTATVATNGFGVNAGITGVPNHFSDILIHKVA